MSANSQQAEPSLDMATAQDALFAVFDAQRVKPDITLAELEARREAAAALVAACAPQDALQASHATRFAAAHYGCMESFRRATLPDMPEGLALRWHGRAIGLSRMAGDTLALLKQCQAETASGRTRPHLAPAEPKPQAAPQAAPQPRPAPEAARPAAARPPAPPVDRQDPMPSERPPVSAILARPAAGNAAPSFTPPRQTSRADLLSSTSQPAGMKLPAFVPAAPPSDAGRKVA